MYETFPSKKHHKQFGEASMSGQNRNRYPPQGLPNTKDDTMKCRIQQSGQTASAPGSDFPKKKLSWPELERTPS